MVNYWLRKQYNAYVDFLTEDFEVQLAIFIARYGHKHDMPFVGEGSIFGENIQEIVTDVEQAIVVINLLRMLISTYAELEKDSREHDKWYHVSRRNRILTLLNALFKICTGKLLVTSLVTGDIDVIFNGVERFAALFAKKIIDEDEKEFWDNEIQRRLTKRRPSPYESVSISSLSEDSSSDDELPMYNLHKHWMSADISFQGEGFVEGLQIANDISSDYLGVLSSEFGKRITTLCSLLICVPALNSIGLNCKNLGVDERMEKALRYDYGKASFVSLPATLIEHSTWIMLKMSQMLMITKKSGPQAGIEALFVSRKDLQKLTKEFTWLKTNSHAFSYCSEVIDPLTQKKSPFTLEGYLSRCNTAIEMTEKILPSLKGDPYAQNHINKMKYELHSFYAACAAELRINDSRPFPYAVCLTGPPSVGKTQIKNIVANQLHTSDNISGRFEIKYNPNLVFTYNADDNFYSGFNTSHTTILMDDIAQKTPDIIKQNNGGDLNDTIKLINSVPFMPAQAELEKKGTTPCRARYVIGTTNVPDLSVKHVFQCPAAVYRRWIFVSCHVKPEYCKKKSSALRGDDLDPTNLDLWNFTIKKYEPQGNSCSEFFWNGTKFIAESTILDVSDLCLFLDTDLNRHWLQQERADSATANLLESEFCIHNISKVICKHCKNEHYIGQANSKINAFQRFFGSCLVVPIYLLFTISVVHSKLYPKSIVSKPVWSLRAARYLTGFMPYDYNKDLKYFRYIPSAFHNYLCQNYWFDRYTEIRGYTIDQSKDLYEWFSTEVMHDWKFQIVVGFLLVLKMLKIAFSVSATGQADVMPVPTEKERKGQNYWQRQYHIGQYPNASSTVTQETIRNLSMMANVGLVVHVANKPFYRTNGIHITSNLIVSVAHVLEDDDEITSIEMTSLHPNGRLVTIVFDMDKSSYYIDRKNDILAFKTNRVHLARNMRKYLLASKKESVNIDCEGDVIYRLQDNGYIDETIHVRRVTNKISCKPYVFQGKTIGAEDCYQAIYDKPSFNGLCGAPVIGYQGKNSILLGIHCAGDQFTKQGGAYIRSLYKDQIDEYMILLNCTVFSANKTDLAYVGNTEALILNEPHPLSPILDLQDKEVIILGDSSLPRAKLKTNVARSPIWESVLNHYRPLGFSCITHTSPFHCAPKAATLLSMEKAVENASFFPSEIEFCVKAITQEFLGRISPERLARIKPYPWSVAVNGCDGIPYLERVNVSTSGGYGHPGPKKNLLILVNSTPEHEVCFEPTPELQKEIDWIMEQYNDYKVANPVFKCSFKDEPITFEKERKNKVRIFSGSPAAFSIVSRKYLLPIIREFVGPHRLDFEMAIGANAHGEDWQHIYKYVTHHGVNRCFAGDYKNFDKQMPPELILGAFQIIKNILIAAGWEEDDLKYVEGISRDTAFPTMDLFGTLIKCYGNNPSGHILTTPINSLVNSLYMRIACRRILLDNNYNVTLDSTGVDFTKFRDIMSLITYGDDNCGSTSDKYPCINHTTIQKALDEAGIIYTTDDKEAKSKGLVNIKTISFLKRRFVFNEDLGRYAAPLLEESIFKALTVWTYSKSISKKEQLAAVLDSMNREYFFFGKEVFEDRHALFLRIATQKEVLEYLPNSKLLDYSDLLSQYQD